jgi:cyclopropane-fatty-acyl-phospholipid synthase
MPVLLTPHAEAAGSSAVNDQRIDRPARLGAVDRALARALQRRLTPAGIRLVLWNGDSPAPPPSPIAGDLVVRTRSALAGLITNPDLRFGEAYMSGAIDVGGDLVTVLERLSRLGDPHRMTLRKRLASWTNRRNSRRRSQLNVHHHYDLGNDFYALWLDRELLYTCAYFPEPDSALEQAQIAKMDLVCRKLAVQRNDEVVEAGCGWGALALHIARRYGARVRAFNISSEQIRYARDRARREGLSHLVEFIEDDYRSVAGTCDVFVSVGMLEHVGVRDFPSFSSVIRRVLRRQSGRGLLHFIGRDRPMPLSPWIRRRIFPGAYPPSVAEVAVRILQPAGLSVIDVENLRLHYARTLQHWLARFESAEDRIRTMFDESFVRAWRLYLAGSQAAFTTGWIQLFQVLFAPSGGTCVRWTRADMYRDTAGQGRCEAATS